MKKKNPRRFILGYHDFSSQTMTFLLPQVVLVCRNPGSNPEWLGNVIIATYIAVVTCLTLVYLLSYVHLSGFYFIFIFSSVI